MDRLSMPLLLLLVAVMSPLGAMTATLAAKCEAGESGECPARDSEEFLAEEVEAQSVSLLQGKVRMQENKHEQEVIDSDEPSNNEEGIEQPRTLLTQRHEEALDDELDDEIDEVADRVETEIRNVEDACQPCDTACLTKNNQEAFVRCDTDKNNKLTVKEVQACLFELAHEPNASHVALSQLLTDAKSAEFVASHDEDEDKELTKEEFLKSMEPCEASLRQEGTVISSTSSVAECVSSTVSAVTSKENYKCTKYKAQDSCSWQLLQTDGAVQAGGRRRKGFGVKKVVKSAKKATKAVTQTVAKVWTCVSQTVAYIADCVKDVVSNIVSDVRASFNDCWNNVISSVGGDVMSLIKDCSNVDNCKDKLLAGPKALFDRIVEDAKKGIENLIEGDIKDAVDYVQGVGNSVPAIATAVGSAFGAAGNAIVKMANGAAQAIRDTELDFCTTDGLGYWNFQATDCGAFAKMKDIFSVTDIGQIQSNFRSAVSKFGTCVTKLGALSLPSPFMDIKVEAWCLPTILQPAFKGVVGSFRWVMKQIAAGLNGCADPTTDVCVMVNDMKEVGVKMKEAFSSSLLQHSAGIVGNATGSQYRADCTGSNFKMFIAVLAAFKFPPPVESGLKVGMQFANGCRDGKYYADILLGVSGTLFLAGYDYGPIDSSEGAVVVEPGFDIGNPSSDIVQWVGKFVIAGEATVFGIKGKIVVSFKMLPDPAVPKGFGLSFGVGTLFLQADAQKHQREIDRAVEKAETVKDKLHAGLGTMLSQMKTWKFKDMTQEENKPAMSQMQVGAHAMAGKAGRGAWFMPETAALMAALGVDFCLTCGDDDVAAGANADSGHNGAYR